MNKLEYQNQPPPIGENFEWNLSPINVLNTRLEVLYQLTSRLATSLSSVNWKTWGLISCNVLTLFNAACSSPPVEQDDALAEPPKINLLLEHPENPAADRLLLKQEIAPTSTKPEKIADTYMRIQNRIPNLIRAVAINNTSCNDSTGVPTIDLIIGEFQENPSIIYKGRAINEICTIALSSNDFEDPEQLFAHELGHLVIGAHANSILGRAGHQYSIFLSNNLNLSEADLPSLAEQRKFTEYINEGLANYIAILSTRENTSTESNEYYDMETKLVRILLDYYMKETLGMDNLNESNDYLDYIDSDYVLEPNSQRILFPNLVRSIAQIVPPQTFPQERSEVETRMLNIFLKLKAYIETQTGEGTTNYYNPEYVDLVNALNMHINSLLNDSSSNWIDPKQLLQDSENSHLPQPSGAW